LPSEPRWLSAAQLTEVNRVTVAASGEPFGLRDRTLLESACAVPQNLWSYGDERDTVNLAVGLLFAVARNHPFVQGNKRTAFVGAINFLELNGWHVRADFDVEHFAELIVKVIEGQAEPAEFAACLADHTQPAAP
jgi:death-on-curing protein